MLVTVRFFGIVSDVAKKKDQSIEVPDGASVADVISAVASSNKGFAAVAKQVRPVVNGETATRDHMLTDGDELVLMRAIGGGS